MHRLFSVSIHDSLAPAFEQIVFTKSVLTVNSDKRLDSRFGDEK